MKKLVSSVDDPEPSEEEDDDVIDTYSDIDYQLHLSLCKFKALNFGKLSANSKLLRPIPEKDN